MATQNILYIEDDPGSRQAIKDVLEIYYDCKVDLAVGCDHYLMFGLNCAMLF